MSNDQLALSLSLSKLGMHSATLSIHHMHTLACFLMSDDDENKSCSAKAL